MRDNNLIIEVQFPRRHKQFEYIIIHFLSLLLMPGDDRLQAVDGALLNFAAQHLTGTVSRPNLLKLRVVFEEERQQLVGDVNVSIAAELPMLLDGHSSTRKSVLVDLRLQLLRRVGEENRRVVVTRRHLRLGALQRGEES